MSKRTDVYSCSLNDGQEDHFRIWSYEFSVFRTALFYFLSITLLGIPLVVAHWRPDWAISWKRRRCTLRNADTVFIKDSSNQVTNEPVVAVQVSSEYASEEFADAAVRVGILPSKSVLLYSDSGSEEENSLFSGYSEHSVRRVTDRTRLLGVGEGTHRSLIFHYFVFRHTRYLLDADNDRFIKLTGLADLNVKINTLVDVSEGLSKNEQDFRLQLFGRNSVDVQIKSYLALLVTEVLNPFYIFQVASIVLWSLDNYVFYATCIFLISTISIGVSLYETRKQSVALHEMVSASNTATVQVLRNDGSTEEISSELLVPGDVIVVPPNGCVMTCDAALIRGTCIVNESMLTGESVPVTKSAVTPSEDQEMYSAEGHKRHTLFSGTHVIQTRFYGHDAVLAVVVRTGFETSKGELVRSILFPKPMKGFKFYADSMKFVLLLFFFAAAGMGYVIYLYISRGADLKRILLRSLDIITVVVPPALPAVMTVGTVYAQNRLKKQNVFCISPPRINVCGKLKLFCFDKTGTLTEEGLDLWGVVPTNGAAFGEPVRNPCPPFMAVDSPMMVALASCHSLTMIDGALTGDPLDVKMFQATQWELEEPDNVSEESRFDLLVPCIVRPPNPSGFRRSELSPMGRASLLPKNQPNGLLVDVSECAPKKLQEPGPDASKFDLVVPSVVSPPEDAVKVLERELLEVEDFALPYEVGIVRQFAFTSSLQRMSVITRTLGQRHMDFYCKGAPEKIAGLCEESTLPSNYQQRLEEFTALGFRVIALAHKKLDRKVTWHHCMRAKRETFEIDLKFLGFLVLQNTLKPETTPVIAELTEARIRSVMITGDNLHTGICVARECGLVAQNELVVIVNAGVPGDGSLAQLRPWIAFELADMPPIPSPSSDGNAFRAFERAHSIAAESEIERIRRLKAHEPIAFALSGKVWNILRNHFPYLVAPILLNAKIFGRMAPDQKAQLVETFQELGFIVGMCGDGANDCGALKTAHVGISLSEAEASVAAPFTSKVSNIRCVPTAIREGRCALVTSFGAFKYMALYSLVQFFSVLILYTRKTNLGDTQYLYIDLFITGTVAVLMGYSQAYPKLHRKRPPGSLVSPRIVASLVVHSLLSLGAQLAAFYVLVTRPWFVPVRASDDEEVIQCWETTVVFCVSSFQYLVLAAVFSRGPPFRKPIYKNGLFLSALLLLGAFNTFLLIYPVEPFASFFELQTNEGSPLDLIKFRLMIFAVPLVHSVVAMLVENQAMERKWFRRFTRAVIPKKTPKNRYKLLERSLARLGEQWPPMVGKKLYPEDEDLTCFGSLDSFVKIPG